MEDLVVDAEERTDARLIRAVHAGFPRSVRPRCAGFGKFGRSAEVQQHRLNPIVEGGVEVVI